MFRIFFLFVAIIFTGCTPEARFEAQKRQMEQFYKLQNMPPIQIPKPIKPKEKPLPPILQKRLSINAAQVPFDQAIKMISFASGVNIITDRPIRYPVSLFMQNAPLKDILSAITTPYGYSYTLKEQTIYIHTYETKMFHLYLPASDRAIGSSLSTTSTTESQSGSSNLQLDNSLKVTLWENIEKTLQKIIEDEEKITVSIQYSTTTATSANQQKDINQDTSTQSQNQYTDQQAHAKDVGSQEAATKAAKVQKEHGSPLSNMGKLNPNVLFPKGKDSNATTKSSRLASTEQNIQAHAIQNQTATSQQNTLANTEQKSLARTTQENIQIQYQLKPFVQIDKLTGTVLVRARPRAIKKIARYIESLNKMFNKEILVDLQIVEFINTKELNHGINWNKLFRDVTLFNTHGPVTISQQFAPTLTEGIQATFNGATFQMLLAALSKQGYTRVISSPRITTLNNQPALIKVGNDRILIYTKLESENTTTQNVSNSVSSVSIQKTPIVSEGLSLLVNPRYNAYSDTILLNITSILQKLDGTSAQNLDEQLSNMVIADPSNFQTHPVPINIQTKQLNAIAKLKDGQILVLGGLSSTIDTNSRSMVPLLGRVPILRELFSHHKRSKLKSFLILLLRVKKL